MDETWHKTFAETREAFRDGDWSVGDALTEASLSRVLHHVQQAGSKGLTVLTAWKGHLPHAVNRQNMEELRHALRSGGYGYNQLRGHWKDVASGEVGAEPSFAVHSLPLEHAKRLGAKYQQDAIVHAGPETNGRIHLIDLSTGEHTDLGEFHPNKTSPSGWSALKTWRHTRAPGNKKGAEKYVPGAGERTYVFEYIIESAAESQLVALHESHRPR